MQTNTCRLVAAVVSLIAAVCAPGHASLVTRGARPPTAAKRGDVWVDTRTDMAFYYVPAGEFVMGSTMEELQRMARKVGGDKDREAYLKMFRSEAPARVLDLPGFWIGKYEVTMEQYARFIRARPERPVPGAGEMADMAAAVKREDAMQGGAESAAESMADYLWNPQTRRPPVGRGKHPVTYIHTSDAEAFCQWAGYQLPTEAQWEKAASWSQTPWRDTAEYAGDYDIRGLAGSPAISAAMDHGDPWRYPWGNVWHNWFNGAEFHFQGCLQTASDYDTYWAEPPLGMDFAAIAGANARKAFANWIRPVGSFPKDKSPYGALDMAGNVTEITRNSRVGSDEPSYVLKGGNYGAPWWNCRAQSRSPLTDGADGFNLSVFWQGFRCVYVPD